MCQGQKLVTVGIELLGEGQDGGGKDAVQRATSKWKQTLQCYQPPPFDSAIDEALREYITVKKETMPDIWH